MAQQLDFLDVIGPVGPTQPEGGYRPDPEVIRAELHTILSEARGAQTLPWKADKALLYRTIFPQICNWLPAEEAAELRAAFTAELARFGPIKSPVNPAHFMPIKQEAQSLASRTGLRPEACLQWMEHVGLKSVLQLKERYDGAEQADCLKRAAEEIEDFICGAPSPTADSTTPACD